MFWTVFPKGGNPDEPWDPDYMPQDFPTKEDAEKWAKELFDIGIESDIEWSEGDYV